MVPSPTFEMDEWLERCQILEIVFKTKALVNDDNTRNKITIKIKGDGRVWSWFGYW